MRTLTHLHTRHSWDGDMRPADLVAWLADNDIELALVSDHDSFDGALACRDAARALGSATAFPLAAEIRTDCGDVIVVLDDETDPNPTIPDISALKSWDSLHATVRERGGLIWLPHPYQSHDDIETLAAGADVIEVFNARCSREQNGRAADLCRRHSAVPGYGADAHRRRDLGRCVVDYAPGRSIRETLLTEPRPIVADAVEPSSIMAAEVVHAWRRRRGTRVAWFASRYTKARAKELVSGWRR